MAIHESFHDFLVRVSPHRVPLMSQIVAGTNCCEQKLATFATFCSRDIFIFKESQQLIPATFNNIFIH